MDKIPHLAAEGAAFFRTGKLSGGGSSRDIILRAQNVLFRLHAALLAAEKEQIESCLGPLLELADALTATAHRGLPKLATPSSGTSEAAELDDETAAELQLKLIWNAAYASTLLLRWVLPACSSSADSRVRVVAASALLVPSELALSALSDLHPCNPALYMTLAQLLEGMGEVLRQCALPPQLQQSNALQSWLQHVVGLVRDDCIMHFPARLGYPSSMVPFLDCMATLGTADERLEGHQAAVCADSQLMGELAALTATIHASMPLCAHESWRVEQATRDLLRWAASWNELPWPEGREPAQPAAVQVAAVRILQGEAQLLQQLALPETPQAVQRWQQAVAAIAPLSSLLLGPCCSASRQCQVVLALAASGPAIARFFPAAAAVLGGPAAAAAEAPDQGSPEAVGHAGGAEVAARGGPAAADAGSLQGTLCEWLSSLSAAVKDLRPPPPASQQRQQLRDRLLELATALAWLAGQMPQAVHALNGGSGPACPADGCSCSVCAEPEETPACTSSAVPPPLGAQRALPQPAATADSERADSPPQQDAHPSAPQRGRAVAACAPDPRLSVPGLHQLKADCLISMLKNTYAVLLKCSSTPAELAAANSEGLLARLATTSCKLPHALCQLSVRHRQILHLGTADGLFPLSVSTPLVLAACWGTLCLLSALQATRPHARDAEAEGVWDRQCACCLLEATAAMAVGWELRPNNAWEQEVERGPREAVLRALRLAAKSMAGEPGSVPQGEEAVLEALGRQLCSEDGRQHLPALLQRLLPAGGGADSEGAAPLPQPLPLEAALFQARALGQARPQCANVRCPTLPAGEDLAGGRGKRCGGCRTVRYCSLACSQQDWRAHKPACRALQAGAGAGSTQ